MGLIMPFAALLMILPLMYLRYASKVDDMIMCLPFSFRRRRLDTPPAYTSASTNTIQLTATEMNAVIRLLELQGHTPVTGGEYSIVYPTYPTDHPSRATHVMEQSRRSNQN